MEVNILNCEKTTLEFELVGAERAIPEMLTNKLSENSGVEFVSYKVEHPLVGSPKIIVKTKTKDALDLTLAAVEEIREEVSQFKKAFKASK